MKSPTKVMVVDDSALVRQVLSSLLDAAPDLRLTHAVADPLLAIERMKQEWPDVIVLDIEMPRMDGITFLRKLMAERPTPVVICSSLTEGGTRISVEALAAGAVAVIAKPRLDLKNALSANAGELLTAVRNAARAHPGRLVPHGAPAAPSGSARLDRAPTQPGELIELARTSEQVVAIGTSTGGTQALEQLLCGLPRRCLGLLIVQHMPENFTAAFAERLDQLCQIRVQEARHGDRVLMGRALIAPGGRHMRLRRNGAQFLVDVVDGPLVNRHRPSVDVLFRSVAQQAGANALGVIMTGMGDDGAAGLLEMHQAGARTLAQNEQSCVVFGMPKEAIKRGAVDKVLPLDAIGREILYQTSEAAR